MDNLCNLRLKWNNFPAAVSSSLESLRNGGDLVDTSLWCEGRCFKAHRVVLSACSHYFRQIFLEVAAPNVQIILSHVPHQDIDLILQFIYSGEVSLSEPQLASFLKTAEILKVKGLGPECTSSFSGPGRAVASAVASTGVPSETQFLAAALQKPLIKRTTPPPLLSVHPFASTTASGSGTPVPVSSTSSLPSIDLGLAISNFTSSNAASNSSSTSTTSSTLSNSLELTTRKRKLLQTSSGGETGSQVIKMEEDRGSSKESHLAMVSDMTPPNSIVTDEPDDPHQHPQQRQDPPLHDRTAAPPPAPPQPQVTPRPYQSQCRGERPRNARIPFCPHCDEDCHNISVLRYHVKTVHSEPSGCLCCCFCTAVFNLHSAAEYKQHTLDTHGVKYI